MAEKALALRLADELEQQFPLGTAQHYLDGEAAAELRRLHAAHDWQYTMAGDRLRRLEKLERVNAELLEALKDAAEAFEILANGGSVDAHQAAQILRSDIAKAEGA